MSPKTHEVADINDLQEEGSRIIVEIEGQEIAVFKYNDEYYAVANYCIHQAGPLCEGGLTDRITLSDDGWGWTYEGDGKNCIVCPWHGWRFDITTGKSVDDGRYRVPTYDVEVTDGKIHVIR